MHLTRQWAANSQIRVVLAVPTPPPFSGPETVGQMLLDKGLGPGFRVHHLRTNGKQDNSAKGKLTPLALLTAFLLWSRLVAGLVRHRPRVVYLNVSQNRTGFLRDSIVILTCWLAGAKLVAHVHGSNFRNFYNHCGRPLKILVRFALGRLAGLILLGERFRSQFEGLVASNRIHVLYNGVDAQPFQEFESPGARVHSGFTVLFVGHLSAAKGFVDLLRAAPKLFEAIPDATIACAGEWLVSEHNIRFDERGRPLASDGEALRQLWEDLNRAHPDRFQHLGVVTGQNKTAAFLGADVLVLPSYSEGFPMAVLEAMAAGLPVVVTPVGALPEVLQEGTNCRFVAPGDAGGLARALIALGRDPEERLRVGAANRALVEAAFTPRVMLEQLAAILRGV